VAPHELLGCFQEVALAPALQPRQEARCRREAVPAPTADTGFPQLPGKGLDADRVEPHQSYVAERSGQLARVFILCNRARAHRLAGVDQHANGGVRLNPEHLQEELLQPQVGAPVHRAQVVAVMEVPVIQELLPGAREAGKVVAAHQARKRPLPAYREALEAFQKSAVDGEFVGCCHGVLTREALSRSESLSLSYELSPPHGFAELRPPAHRNVGQPGSGAADLPGDDTCRQALSGRPPRSATGRSRPI
jgi:hypothetical protein